MGFQETACASAYLGKEKSKNGTQRRIRQLLVLLFQVRRQGPDGFPSVVVQFGRESGPVRRRRGEGKRLEKAVAYGRGDDGEDGRAGKLGYYACGQEEGIGPPPFSGRDEIWADHRVPWDTG